MFRVFNVTIAIVLAIAGAISLRPLDDAEPERLLDSTSAPAPPRPEPWTGGIFPSEDQTCRWTNFRLKGSSAQPYEMCVHAHKDRVSDRISKLGYWRDCDILSRLWNDPNSDSSGEYIEIGGNIGACVMMMLVSSDAKITVFEPNPRNLFCMTSTLARLPATMRDRVTVYPYALGSSHETSSINAAKGNMGNGVVGKVVADSPSQVFNAPVVIQVWRYDQIISPHTKVKLLKMDAQGFECNIIRGMGVIVPPLIKTEVSNRWLSAQDNCSADILFSLFLDRKMKLFSEDNKKLLKPRRDNVYDILARAKKVRKIESNHNF